MSSLLSLLPLHISAPLAGAKWAFAVKNKQIVLSAGWELYSAVII